mmetsp:Transcript_5827/g.15889  ORF Transcript_5827/g.15889 Transcript_5827/m.15889 type:complete len:173 (-) Transcript_5827:255-773(-)
MDPRRVLNITSDQPSTAEVKAAWRQFAKEWHPDLHPAGAKRLEAEERFKRAQDAYQSLIDRIDQRKRGLSTAHSPDVAPPDRHFDSASYVRRRRPHATAAADYASVAYDKNAGTKITIGFTMFAFFAVWAWNAWCVPHDHEDRRRQQQRSTVSYGEQHAFWRRPPPPAHSTR